MIIKKIVKDWTLITAMSLGVLCFLAFAEIPFLNSYKDDVNLITGMIMPVFMFTMLLFSFTSISPRDIKFRVWHLWNSLFQLLTASVLMFVMLPVDKEIASATFISFICPTAVASTVITDKLKGNVATLVTYVLIINCIVSIAIPILIPFVERDIEMSFFFMVWQIMKKIFPLLVVPIIVAWTCRWLLPKVHNFLYTYRWVSFYIWALSLVILIADIADSVLSDGCFSMQEIRIMGISLFACIIQFAVGRFSGKKCDDVVSARQALGQKNTIFAIWFATTFMDPVVALAPGSYIIWQNIINSMELSKSRKKES